MNYTNRLPVIGGLIEITKSKKGIAFLLSFIVLFGGGYLGVDHATLLMIAANAWVYIGGLSYKEARETVDSINTKVIEAVEDVIEDAKEVTEVKLVA